MSPRVPGRPLALDARRILPLLLLLASPAAAQGSAGTRPATRIAVFDSRIVLDSMPERARAESEFALEQAKARALLSTATDSLRAAVDEFAKLEQRVSPREREVLSLQVRARELMVEELMARLDESVQRRHRELRQPLTARIADVAQRVRAREGVDLLIDRASEGLLLDADARIDLTSVIIRELRDTSRVVGQRDRPPREQSPG